MRKIIFMLLSLTLTACVCLPESEKGEGVGTDYFGKCWVDIKKDRREQVLFQKPT